MKLRTLKRRMFQRLNLDIKFVRVGISAFYGAVYYKWKPYQGKKSAVAHLRLPNK